MRVLVAICLSLLFASNSLAQPIKEETSKFRSFLLSIDKEFPENIKKEVVSSDITVWGKVVTIEQFPEQFKDQGKNWWVIQFISEDFFKSSSPHYKSGAGAISILVKDSEKENFQVDSSYLVFVKIEKVSEFFRPLLSNFEIKDELYFLSEYLDAERISHGFLDLLLLDEK